MNRESVLPARPFAAAPSGLLQRKCACGQHTISASSIQPPSSEQEGEADRVAALISDSTGVVPRISRNENGIARRMGDGHDLTARRFSRNAVLEAVFDNEQLLRRNSTGTAVR